MKFVSFDQSTFPTTRFGVVLDDGRIVDVESACTTMLAQQMPVDAARERARMLAPHDALAFISRGDEGVAAAQQVIGFLSERHRDGSPVQGLNGEQIVFDASDVSLRAPVRRPRKFIAAGKNFRDHMAEMSGTIPIPRRPVAFAQMATTIIGPDATIPYSEETKTVDYEVEVAVVIGKPALRITADTALDHVFGYTIFNDISARDVYREEGKTGIPLLGKNLPGFAPLGPVLCTRDEIANLPEVRLELRVNGETRQNATLASMIFDIPEVIAYWSQIGLEPGDILTTGTPSGVAAGRKPGETPWWLKPGDVVEAEVSGIGVLRNTVGQPSAHP